MRDVNNTRYHLIFGSTDWNRSQSENPSNRRWEYNEARHGLQLQAEIFTFNQQGSAATPLTLADKRDSDRDPYGHWYWIDETATKIKVRWAKAQATEILFPVSHTPCPPASTGSFQPAKETQISPPETLSGLAIVEGGYLVVGSPDTHSLLVFDLYAFNSTSNDNFIRLPLPTEEMSEENASAENASAADESTADESTETLPGFDLAALPQGGLLVLNKANKTVLRLGIHLQSVSTHTTTQAPATFQPKAGPARQQSTAPDTVTISLSETTQPSAIAPLPDGSFWILDQANPDVSTLWYYPNQSNTNTSTTPTPTAIELRSTNLVDPNADDLNLGNILAYDLVYQPSPTQPASPSSSIGQLFLVDIMGNQAYRLNLTSLTPEITLRIDRRYYPLRRLQQVALVAPSHSNTTHSNATHSNTTHSNATHLETYYLQQASSSQTNTPQTNTSQITDRWLPIKALPQQRYETKATIILSALDGHEPECLWHRLCLDACLSPDTQLTVEARVAEQSQELSLATWQPQPTPYLRTNPEIPHGSLWNETERSQPHTGTWELLFQQLQGRYLQLRLTLIGNGRSTPLIRALRIHYPRFSYLQTYLPSLYQQEPSSASFLDRFLANPEGLLTTLEGQIAQVQTLFDIRTTPSEATDWLASWIGLTLDPSWSDYQRRLLIAHAPYFYQRRGTQVGLLQAILLTIYPEFGPRIFQDNVAELCPTVRIVERFLTRTHTSVAAGDPTEITPTTPSTSTQNIYTEARAKAHRFTVLIPTTLSDSTQSLIERIVNLEKPAHTDFTIKQYWALFRVGEVRLGIDTVLGQGGQFETIRLGESALAEATLGESFPYSLRDRIPLAK